MLIIKNILQHYNPNDHQDIIRLINGFNEVEDKMIIKDLGFLNPNLLEVIDEFRVHYPTIKVIFDGGYEDAIRKKVIIYPDFYEDIDSNIIIYNLEYVNKFDQLDHRHVLGTLLNNGINESMIGDIIVDNDGFIQIVMDRDLDETIHYLITKISNLTVKLVECDDVNLVRKQKPLSVYKSRSLRVDSVLKAVLRISRNQCTKLLKSSKVRINYSVVNDLTLLIKEKDVISVRGYGHFEIEEIREVNNGYNIFYR